MPLSSNADYPLRLRMFQRMQSRYSGALESTGPAYGLFVWIKERIGL
jgi:hypothetical protein